MQTFLLVLITSGFVVLQSTKGQAEHVGRCSYAGVVHLDGSSQYSLNFEQAQQLCQSLGYSLATEEQLDMAYNKGLKTCRYGWIEGQKISILPHNADPNCTSNYTGIISHAEKANMTYDVYCYSQSDSSELSCKGAITSTPASLSNDLAHSQLTTTNGQPDPEGDILEEAIADGFILNVITTTLSVKSERPGDTYKTSTTSSTLNFEGNPSHSLQEDSMTTVTVLKDPEVTTVGTEFGTWSTKEVTNSGDAETSPTSTIAQDLTTLFEENSESTTLQTAFVDFGITRNYTPVKLTTEEPINGIENINIEGSSMTQETVHENENEDLLSSTRVSPPPGSLHTIVNLVWSSVAEDGSGMGPEGTTSNRLTSEGVNPLPTIILDKVTLETDQNLQWKDSNGETKAEGPFHPNSRIINILSEDTKPTISARVEEGTPGWLIIFAFCITLGAIVCILAAIATKDKWYGPSRRSFNITSQETNEEYGKTATLPLSEKEQELMTLMNKEQANDKDFIVISLEKAPEKEYLM